ncbi:hypothetical protein K8I61_20115 [bacterium]|nr:hypothetical protein [bacterium]
MTPTLAARLETLARFADERFRPELTEARTAYFQEFGVGDSVDPAYEEALSAFLDWFLFERLAREEAATPARLYVEQIASAGASENEVEIFRRIAEAPRSLFQIRRIREDALECRDLFSREDVVVSEPTPAGFFREEIYEARLIRYEDAWQFGELLRFHPPRASRVIARVVKGVDRADTPEAREILRGLALCKVKTYRFPRIDAYRIYKERFPD